MCIAYISSHSLVTATLYNTCHTLQYFLITLCDDFLSHFVILVTLCNNFLSHFVIIITVWIGSKTRDLGLTLQDPEFSILDPGFRTLDSNTRTQDLGRRLRTKNPDPEPNICGQGLGFMLQTVWTCLAQMIFIIWIYSLQINTNIDINIFK